MPKTKSTTSPKDSRAYDYRSVFGLCPVCERYVPAWQTFCSPACMLKGYGKLERIGPAAGKRWQFQQKAVPEQEHGEACKCPSCHLNLRDIFPGAKIWYETPFFEGSRCRWHWEVRGFKYPTDVTVTANDEDSLYVTFQDRRKKHAIIDAGVCPPRSWSLLRNSFKWRK